MPRENKPPDRSKHGTGRDAGARRLIAGLRVTPQDEALLAVVRPYLADVGSEGELAYRLWRRGLDVTLAEVVGLGATLTSAMTEELLAGLVAQRLMLSLPLLRRTGTLALLGLEAPPLVAPPTIAPLLAPAIGAEAIDAGATKVIRGLGGSDFL